MITDGDFSWEGEESNGMRLRAANLKRGVGGLAVWLQRRTLIAQPQRDETVNYEQRWFLVAELAFYAPISFAEMASALALTGAFAKWLDEPPAQPPQTPQGLAN